MADKRYKLSFELSDGSTKDLQFTAPQGDTGKTAYEYAKEGGYTGTEAEFAAKLAKKMPEALPNPYPLTINGKAYDGSEAVDVVVTGGTASGNTLLGQTPIILPQSASIKLVGDGEYSYTLKGKTVADMSTATVSKTNATLTETEEYIEAVSTGGDNWYSSYLTLSVSGLTVGTPYILAVSGLGVSLASQVSNGHFIIKNASGTQLAASTPDSASLASIEFTPDTTSISIVWYPAGYYYWNNNCRTARIADLYINKASDGTDRTGVINESGAFTDSYSLGQLQKGITITSEPSCEVYSVSGGGGGGSGEASAPLAGKNVVCFGDSLFGMYTGDTSAPAYAAKKTGATVYNVGFGGCRMSEHPYTGYNEFCMYALANAIASGDWSAQDAAASSGSANFPDQLAILKAIDFNTVDYVVIHYGTNDFAAGAGVAIDNPGNPKATNTLCGALRHSVETLLGAFPKLKIFVSLPAFRYWTADDGTVTYSDEKMNVNGHTLPDFVKALAETAKEYKLPVIDCYYGLGINKNNAGTFLADGTHHNVEGRKRFGEYIGAKLISEGDTFHGADTETGGGSASIDVTAEVGQTIVVEEVDASGKPTKWKAAEYQPRTHWSENVEVLPETTCEVVEDIGAAMLPDMAISAGDPLIVVFNGTEYTGECADVEGNLAFGNWGAMQENPTDTGEPFVAMQVDADESTKVWVVVALDGSATFTLSVVAEKNHTLPEKYISSDMLNVPFYDLEADGFTGLTIRDSISTYVVSNEFCSFAQKAHKRGGGVLRVSALISEGSEGNTPLALLRDYSCHVHYSGGGGYDICFEYQATRCLIKLNAWERTASVNRYSFRYWELV